MQAYGRAFAFAYNLRWGGFARTATPALLAFYLSTPLGQAGRPVLDLCCGTGLLAASFLERGFPVTGLDLSPHMLAHARTNTARFVTSGQARYVLADAARFAMAANFGLVVATYDALNHLPDFAALRGCLRSVGSALAPGGFFIFDLNTRRGLESWTSTTVDDNDAALVITRGVYDGESGRATLNITGFLRAEGGAYERFDERVFNTAFDIQPVLWSLLDSGFASAYAGRLDDLRTPVADPEAEGRVFIVAQRRE